MKRLSHTFGEISPIRANWKRGDGPKNEHFQNKQRVVIVKKGIASIINIVRGP